MRSRLFALGFVILLAAIVANTLVGLDNSRSISDTQRQQAETLKASTKTRVVTVAQRCELTSEVRAIDLLDRRVLLLAHDPVDAAAFAVHAKALAKSYAGCEKQLVQVTRINAAAPGP